MNTTGTPSRLSPELARVCDDAWRLQMEHSPFDSATAGEPGATDRFPDTISASHPFPLNSGNRNSLLTGYAGLNARLEGITAQSHDDTVVLGAMQRLLKTRLIVSRNTDYRRPVSPDPHTAPRIYAAGLQGNAQYPLRKPEDLDSAVKRAEGFSAWVDIAIYNLKRGAEEGTSAPQRILFGELAVQENLIRPDRLEELVEGSVRNIADVSPRQLRTYADSVTGLTRQGYSKLNEAIRDILPHARSDEKIGLCHIPDGRDEYDRLLGLRVDGRSVADLEEEAIEGHRETRAELLSLVKKLGHSSLAEALDFMSTDAQFKPFETTDEVLAHFENHRDTIVTNGHKVIGIPPDHLRYNLSIDTSGMRPNGTVSFELGSLDGSRKNAVAIYVDRPSEFNIVGTVWDSLHEGLGHNSQITAQQATERPPFLKLMLDNFAFIEGYAMDMEQYADELGLQPSDYDRVDLLHRRMRCFGAAILDLDINYSGRPMDEAARFAQELTGYDSKKVVEWLLRFVARPAQVHAYNAHTVFSRLRSDTRDRIEAEGGSFNPAGFNAMLIKDGAVPFGSLSDRAAGWRG